MAEESTNVVEGVVRRYGGDADMLIPMMQDVQAECGYLPRRELGELSGALGVPLSRIYGIATFYASFRLMPKGEHTIQLCMGTVCFLKGAEKISASIQKEFELVAGGTSPDGKFTFAPVNCLGACALAPVMTVDGEYHGGLTPDSAVELLHGVAAGGHGGEGAPPSDEGGEEPGEGASPEAERPGETAAKPKGPASSKKARTLAGTSVSGRNVPAKKKAGGTKKVPPARKKKK